MTRIDVLINAFGKPYQTALSLLSLLRYSGDRIGTIYFHEECRTSEFERKDFTSLKKFLAHRLVVFSVPLWLGRDTVDEQRLLKDEEYRLSIRYQYGWEQTDKRHVLLVHNDIEVTSDPVGPLLEALGEATAAGEIGQCWWCPAGQNNLCSSEEYTRFRPKYHQLMYLYNTNMDYTKRRAYNLGLRAEYWENPWPLPECRVNEWCMLVNMEKAKPDTFPLGSAVPLGAFIASGAKIGEQWEDTVNLDTGVKWFRDMNHLGHTFVHYPVERHIRHDRQGSVALGDAELYVRNEMRAKQILHARYPEYAAALA